MAAGAARHERLTPRIDGLRKRRRDAGNQQSGQPVGESAHKTPLIVLPCCRSPSLQQEGGTMSRRLLLLCLALIPTALAGPRLAAQDAKAVLRAVEKNIGADSLQCITYSGAGYVGIVGQNYTPRDDWPRVELASYKKTVNFDTKIRARRTGDAPGHLPGPRRRRPDRGRGAAGDDGERRSCLGPAGNEPEPGRGCPAAARSLADTARLREGGAGGTQPGDADPLRGWRGRRQAARHDDLDHHARQVQGERDDQCRQHHRESADLDPQCRSSATCTTRRFTAATRRSER